MRTGLSSLRLALIVATLASAQPNTISTYAGGGPVNGPALSINVAPLGVAATANGDVYFASLTAVYKVSGGIAILIAGTPGIFGFNGDNGPAARAALSYASGVAVDGSGNIYIEDSGNNRIRKVSATTGLITTVAGNGSYGYRGDEGPATNASLRDLNGVAADGSGNIYIADAGNHCVRKVSADTGVITTIAGNGNGGFSGDGGPATSANLSNISGVAVDGSGNVYIADKDNGRVRKVSADTGVITTVAGSGTFGYRGDGGPATSATLYDLLAVAVDRSGNIYIVDTSRIRKVSADTGLITTVAGNDSLGYSGDGGPATSASLNNPFGVAVDGKGNFSIADTYNARIRRVSADTGVITTVAGNGTGGFSGDGGPATGASLNYPGAMAVDAGGNIYIADSSNNRIRKVSAETGVITTVAGNGSDGFSGDGGPAVSAGLYSPFGVAVDGIGTIYISDSGNNRIRKVSAETGVITTVVGDGSHGYSGDGGLATGASLADPLGLAVDGSRNIYISDRDNNRIRRVSADTGVITTVAGNDSLGYSGDGGPAISASLNDPRAVAVDGAGNVYIADRGNNRIRKISAGTGLITTVAGNDAYGFSGDGGLATGASLANPLGLAVDGSRNLYIADSYNNRIRKVSADTGVITTVAGSGSYGFSGDGGPGTDSRLANPSGVAVDSSESFYIVDALNQRIRKVDHRLSTTTHLTSNANPTTTQNLVVTAAINSADATGSVQFFDGMTALGSAALSAGTATLSDLSLTVGLHSLVAVYSGDTNYAMSTSAALLQVVSSQAISTMTLISDAEASESCGLPVYVSTLNSPVTFTATLTPAEATGTVQFLDGQTSLGVQPVSVGAAVFTTSSLPAGTHRISAVYSGDANFMPRRVKAITLQVRDTAPENNVNTSLTSR